MRRALSIALVASAFAAAPADAAPRQSVRLVDCQPGSQVAVFEGRMRTEPGAQRMQMRFVLQSRSTPRQRWRGVPGPGLGRWVVSDAGVARYVYTKRVANLVAPAAYRMVVRFRWVDAAGHRVDEASDLSAVCNEPDLRPNLRPLSLDVAPAAEPGKAVYSVALVNRGRGPSEPFELALSADGQALASQSVDALAPGEQRVVSVTAPRCQAGSALAVDLDPADAVDERVEIDNRLSRRCPPPG